MHILDNYHHSSLADYLREHLPNAVTLRLVSAYFSIYGYETLADTLDSPSLKKVKFLFGEPSSAGSVSGGKQTHLSFNVGEDGLNLPIEAALQQREIALQCANWIKSKQVEVRTISKQNFMHGKMYHTTTAAGGGTATVGSSNFTRRGLGKTQTPNIELNTPVTEQTHQALTQWFDKIWQDKDLTRDAKKELLEALDRWHKQYAPEFLYYKTLYELFREELEAQAAEDTRLSDSHLYDSAIWKALYEFQKDGAKSVINRLLRHNGCILADSVGLGKTYTALAVIKFFELRNERVLVLCPKKLENNWRVYQAASGATSNPFTDDRFSYVQLAHTDLSRENGTSGNVELNDFNWSSYDLIVIDESHNFRNQSKTRRDAQNGEAERIGRYEKLLTEVIAKGVKTKVLMLSATPVNTSLLDLRNQIYLITEGRDDVFSKTLEIKNIKDVVKKAQDHFEQWEKTPINKRLKTDLLNQLGGDFLRLLSGVVIARSRKQISQFYGDYIKQYGDFPKRQRPQNKSPHTDIKQELSYQEVYEALEKINFHIYRPSNYVTDTKVQQRLADEKQKLRFNQETREKFLVAMMHINFLKRLESSAHALSLTLQRTQDKIAGQIDHIDRYLQTKQANELYADTADYEDDEDEEFIVSRKARNPYHLRELNVTKWREAMHQDAAAIQTVQKLINKITPERDGKLDELKQQIRQKVKQSNKKLLIFTTFKDTAAYLYEHIAPLAAQLKVKAALVAGDETKTQYGRNAYTDILNNFSPHARIAAAPQNPQTPQQQIDILIATDCISEGQNLQDCDTVLNYDIHWNPVRIIQRFGRIDRIGSKNAGVQMINFWPMEDIDAYLKLRRRVHARMALVDAAATGDDDTLADEEEIKRATETYMKGQMAFHDDWARKIREEVIDLEDLSGSISVGDLTLNYFLMQLLRYLREHKEELENTPPGIYAVADAADAKTAGKLEPGVIFFFRQKQAADKTADNPVHPFYLVHTVKDGVRRYYTQANEILYLLEQLTLQRPKPILSLCDAFVKNIKTAEGKAPYDKMAKAAIASIEKTSKKNIIEQLKKDPKARVPKAEESPRSDNLELITWLVIS